MDVPVIAKTVQSKTISPYQRKVHLGGISFCPRNRCKNVRVSAGEAPDGAADDDDTFSDTDDGFFSEDRGLLPPARNKERLTFAGGKQSRLNRRRLRWAIRLESGRAILRTPNAAHRDDIGTSMARSMVDY